jgi:hypothetical protein
MPYSQRSGVVKKRRNCKRATRVERRGKDEGGRMKAEALTAEDAEDAEKNDRR